MCLKMCGYIIDSKFIHSIEIPIGKKLVVENDWLTVDMIFKSLVRFEPCNVYKNWIMKWAFKIDSDQMLVASWLIVSSSIYLFLVNDDDKRIIELITTFVYVYGKLAE